MAYTINQLAKLAGVSVRTLHHYDAIGLLKPTTRAKNSYRQYEPHDLVRLQQILFFRELDFSLADIQRMLNSPHYDPISALEDQKKLIQLKRARLQRLLKTINKTIITMTQNQATKPEDMYDVFKDDDVKKYQAEVQSRWGNTKAYAQSMQRAKSLTKQQIDKLKADGKIFNQKLAAAMPNGVSDATVQTLIAQHYKGINFWYNCSYDMYRNLGKMYVQDARFTATYEKVAPGLAQFMHEAIDYFCDQHLQQSDTL